MLAFKRDLDVLVVGAGPVGLAAGLALAQRDVRVQVVDEQPRTAARSYALALHPRSLEILSELGLAEELIALGHKVEAVAFYEGSRRRAEVRLGDRGARFPFALAVPQQVLEERLERRLAQRGVEVRWNHRLASLALNGLAHVTLERLALESAGYSIARTEWVVEKEFTARAPYVVGADGHRSSVRRKLGIPFESVGPSQLFAVFEFTADGPPLAEARVVLADRKVSALWPLGPDAFRFAFEVDEQDFASAARQKSRLVVVLGESSFDYLKPELLGQLLRDRAPWFEGRVREVAWSLAVRFERRAAEPFGRSNVWLAGDSAHLAPPMACWSMNAGLEEAVDLAKRLDAVLHRGAPLEVLDEYGEERERAWRALSEARCHGTGASDPWVKENARAILECLPALGRDLSPLLGQLALAWNGSP
jgi:2-polyprenyl-6-methoxyphenol hydroxylase-like FAD-dependent oxidoreductase